MKRVISLALCLVMIACSLAVLASCGKKYEIAVVTDVGQLMDKGFNQGTYEGAKSVRGSKQSFLQVLSARQRFRCNG